MAEITKIKPQKSSKGRSASGRKKPRVNIYLDGKFAFPLDADNFLKAGLKIGQQLTEKQVEDLIFKNQSQKLLDKTYRLISLRPRSEKEIKDYLKKKKAPPKLSSWVIRKLKKQKIIDDNVFASWWVEQRSTFRPRGKFGLTMELRQKGVDEKIIKKIVEEKVNELPLAKKLAQKKLKSYKNLPRKEFYQKMSAFLARRGFSWQTIKTVIDEIAKKR